MMMVIVEVDNAVLYRRRLDHVERGGCQSCGGVFCCSTGCGHGTGQGL